MHMDKEDWKELVTLLREASYQLGVCNPFDAGNHKQKIDEYLKEQQVKCDVCDSEVDKGAAIECADASWKTIWICDDCEQLAKDWAKDQGYGK